MKKSKLFLTAGAVVLAISAVFATKAKNFINGYYYLTTGGSAYVSTPAEPNCTPGSHFCSITLGGTAFPVYYLTVGKSYVRAQKP